MFSDRADAGRQLGQRLQQLCGQGVVVLGLPRGGVLVAAEVARALDAPLDVIMVRKLGVPFQPELAMGALGEGGVQVIDESLVHAAGVSRRDLAAVEERERVELGRRSRRFRGGRERIPLDGRTAVIVDDGIATGATARVACRIARHLGAVRVVLAVPVAPPGWTRDLRDVADELIALATPEHFFGIGQFYRDFSQTSDEEVMACLRPAGNPVAPQDDPPGRDEDVEVPAGDVRVQGRLTVPDGASGVVVFAHGSGSGRHSPRNRYVAAALNRAGLGTLLIDLLTEQEELDRGNVFDIELLAERLIAASDWLAGRPGTSDNRIGYFGASTGAGAALWAAAQQGDRVAAVVSRGGRPDLAAPRLTAVTAPTLLIVGSLDYTVLELNRFAHARLRDSRLAVIPGATHLFEEPGALAKVAELARDWFTSHLVRQATTTS